MIRAVNKAVAVVALTASFLVADRYPVKADTTTGTIAAFRDLEALLSLPNSCAAALSARLRPTMSQDFTTRDPMTQRSVERPICAAIRACASSLSSQSDQLKAFILKNPRVVDELRLKTFRSSTTAITLEDTLHAMARGRRALNSFNLLDGTTRPCDFVYETIDSEVFPLSRGGTRVNGDKGLSAFLPAARQMLGQWRAEYAAQKVWYRDWAPYAHTYPSASELKRKFGEFEAAFNGSDAEAFLGMRNEVDAQRKAADAFRQKLIRQTERLAELDDQLSGMTPRINSAMVAFGGQDFGGAVTSIRIRIAAIRNIDPAKRGDATDHIRSIAANIVEIDGALAAAETTIALLKRQEVHRIASLNSVNAAYEILSQQAVQAHLDPEARKLLNRQLDEISQQLSGLAITPVLQRSDSTPVLAAADAMVAQVTAIENDRRELGFLQNRGQKLRQHAHTRGKQYLDDETSAQLSNIIANFNDYILPLSAAGRARIDQNANALAVMEKSLPGIMDAGEIKALSKLLPQTSGSWTLSLATDKLTDVTNAEAQVAVSSRLAVYRIKMTCIVNPPPVEISVFEPSSWSPLRWLAQTVNGRAELPIWQPGISVAPMQLRIDNDPVEPVLLIQDGRSNTGRLVTDKLGRLLSSKKIILAGLLAGETIEIQMGLPRTFVRLCELMAMHQPR